MVAMERWTKGEVGEHIMRLSFNHKFYRNWPFWVGIAFLVGDGCLRLFAGMLSDPLGVMIGLMWLAIGLFYPLGRP